MFIKPLINKYLNNHSVKTNNIQELPKIHFSGIEVKFLFPPTTALRYVAYATSVEAKVAHVRQSSKFLDNYFCINLSVFYAAFLFG